MYKIFQLSKIYKTYVSVLKYIAPTPYLNGKITKKLLFSAAKNVKLPKKVLKPSEYSHTRLTYKTYPVPDKIQ